jgi:Transposase IS4
MDDAKKRAKQIEHLKDWPSDSIRPYKPPAFSGHSGPTLKQRFSSNPRYRSPLAAFELFFDDSVFTLLLTNTNATGRRKHADWVDCDEPAMRALVGTAIRLSKCSMLVLHDY